jgi:predicted ATPase
MIRRIEAKNYRSLKYMDQSLESFHVLVGPNASGKTTFMDIVSFLAEIVKSGIDVAIQNRSANYRDLTFSSKGGDIELAIEINIAGSIKQYLDNRFDRIRYEIRFGLTEETQDSLSIREASPPGQSKKFKTDGSNLPWVINDLRNDELQYKKWIAHIRTALPDVIDIDTVERKDDRHRYLRVLYEGNIQVPSWLVSDGTLRLLALTLPAYLSDFTGVYLIEEPENGIHPKAVESVFQSLSSVYNAQIILASHSPVVLSLVKQEDVLCFAKTREGITDIVKGSEHPALKDWRGETNLSVLFASGILG